MSFYLISVDYKFLPITLKNGLYLKGNQIANRWKIYQPHSSIFSTRDRIEIYGIKDGLQNKILEA